MENHSTYVSGRCFGEVHFAVIIVLAGIKLSQTVLIRRFTAPMETRLRYRSILY